MQKEYVSFGLALCPIPAGSKGPRTQGWNLQENAITDSNDPRLDSSPGFGLCHSWSGTCALDIDDESKAGKFFQQFKTSGCGPDSGRPGRWKRLYKIPFPMTTVTGPGFELRCSTAGGLTVQDVLPPSIHPETKKPYVWHGDWREIQDIPTELFDLWVEMLKKKPDTEPAVKTPAEPRWDLVARLLTDVDPDIGYAPWIHVLMAIHHETGGSEEGFETVFHWSARGTKFKGEEDVRAHWRSFSADKDALITLNSQIRAYGLDAATPDEFDEVKERGEQEKAILEYVYDWGKVMEENEKIGGLKWQWHGVFQEIGLALIAAEPGAGKTTFVRQFALCASRGESFLGRDMKKSKVLLCSFEDNLVILAQHFQQLGLSETDKPNISMVFDGALEQIGCSKKNIAGFEKMLDLLEPSVVIIDTVNDLCEIADDNKNSDVTKALKPLHYLAKKKKILIVLVHHCSSKSSKALMGSTAFKSVPDTVIEMRGAEEMHRTLVNTKQRGPKFDTIHLSYDAEKGELTNGGTVMNDMDGEEKIRHHLRNGEWHSKRSLQRKFHSQKVIFDLISDLAGKGVLESRGTGSKSSPEEVRLVQSLGGEDVS